MGSLSAFLTFPSPFHMRTVKCLLRNSTWIWIRKIQITLFSLCPCSGLCLVQKTTWFTSGTFRQKRLYRNYKDTQVRERVLLLLIKHPSYHQAQPEHFLSDTNFYSQTHKFLTDWGLIEPWEFCSFLWALKMFYSSPVKNFDINLQRRFA